MRAFPSSAAALLLAACASGGGAGGGGGGDRVLFTVDNSIIPPTPLTVRLVSEGGVRSFLGRVPSRGTETFEYSRSVFAGFYQLVAETVEGREVGSRPFDLFPGAEVQWSLPSNSLSMRLAEIEDGPDDRLEGERPEEAEPERAGAGETGEPADTTARLSVDEPVRAAGGQRSTI